jgi:hypothetical protein
MDVAAWLRGLGLERYVPAFRGNEIDEEMLPKLTSEDLREIGVAAIGHRRKLLDAIAALGASAPTAAVRAAASDGSAPAEAERRQLTVMFCDLVGSTALAVRLNSGTPGRAAGSRPTRKSPERFISERSATASERQRYSCRRVPKSQLWLIT